MTTRRAAEERRPHVWVERRCGCVVQPVSRMDVAPMAPYEILMPATIIRYGIFAAFGARKRPY